MSSATPLKLKPSLIKAIIVSLVVAGLSLAYLSLIGIPKTQARNLFNHAETAKSEGNYTEANRLMKEAYATWPELYIQERLAVYDLFERMLN